jgi:methylated-DNA-[protein]-cysteine S-methyltransferase
MPKLILQIEHVPSPVGNLTLLTDESGKIRILEFNDSREDRFRQSLARQFGPDGVDLAESYAPSSARRALEAYFDGELTAIDALEVEASGTPFQREVWAALRGIRVGSTISYGQLAVQLDRPKAVRAVGVANGANPIAIVVPCHRVIGSDASLTGYGGGLERKRWLLEHEGVLLHLNSSNSSGSLFSTASRAGR